MSPPSEDLEGRLPEAASLADAPWRRIANAMRVPMWLLDGSGRTLHLNDALATLLSVGAVGIRGRSLLGFVREPARSTLRGWLERPEPEGGGGPMGAVFVRQDGSAFAAQVTVRPLWRQAHTRAAPGLEDLEGFLVAVIPTVDEATTRRRLEEARLASVGMMAAGIAHEINNALASMLTNLHMAVDDVEHAAQPADLPAQAWGMLRDELRETLQAAQRVRDIVTDLKTFSRPHDKPDGSVSIEPVLEAALRLAWNEIKHRARVFRAYAPVPPVRGSESRLVQVFVNLLLNAAQSIPEGNTDEHAITVATSADQDSVFVTVRDTGIGMTPELLRRAFTPFFTTKPEGVGTGLGLPISHDIVRSFGGDITATSTPGFGSEFRVRLAMGAKLPQRPPSPPPPRAHADLESIRVLVVDDDAAIGAVMQRALRSMQVTAVSSAHAALTELERGGPRDVIFCDLLMPQTTGMEFYDEVVARWPELAANVVFMTGAAFTPRVRAFLDGVPNPCLEKPFDPKLLRGVVADHVARLRSRPSAMDGL